jgi:Fur family transcriptional regulator, ferric uptake regulator
MTTSGIDVFLKSKGLKKTQIRKKMISYLKKSKSPVTALEIQKEVGANKSTVYREIDLLTLKGYINEFDFGDGVKRYEDSSREHHHHLICLNCRSITEFEVKDNFAKIEEKEIRSQKKFTVLKHKLEFFGKCKKCSKT